MRRLMERVVFLFFAGLMLVGAISVILARNPVYSVLCLVLTMFAISGLFVLLHAYFIAVIQLVVYAGAVLVLFLFVLMLLDLGKPLPVFVRPWPLWLGAGLAGLGFLAALVQVISRGPATASRSVEGTTAAIGKLLFSQYLVPFEVTSLLLLAAIIGAVVLAKSRWPA